MALISQIKPLGNLRLTLAIGSVKPQDPGHLHEVKGGSGPVQPSTLDHLPEIFYEGGRGEDPGDKETLDEGQKQRVPVG